MKKKLFIPLLILCTGLSPGLLEGQNRLPAPSLEPAEQRRQLGELHESKRFYTDHAPELTVFTFSGDIEVVHNPDIHYLQLDLYVRRSFSIWSRRDDLENYRILMNQRDGEINASVERRRSGGFWGRDDTSFTFIIQSPSDISTHLRTLKGDILIHDLSGIHRVQTSAGNLSGSFIDGEIQANSTAGNISVSDSRGKVNIQSLAGNIDLRNIAGEIRVRSTAGNITGESLSGSLLTRSVAGQVRADFLHVGEGISVESTAGNVVLLLPDNQGFDIDAKGMNLTLSGFDDFRGLLQRMSANGTVGNGSSPVQVRTSAGSVTIQKRTSR